MAFTLNGRRHRFCARTLLLTAALVSLPGLAAPIEGSVMYRERIMPPPDAILVVTLEDTARADAPATELVSSRTRLAGGPPYAFRLELDERLLSPQSRPGLRARIETADGLWMTTDQFTAAMAGTPSLQLRRVEQAAPACASAATPKAEAECAYDGFLDASAGMARQIAQLNASQTSKQRSAWRAVQKAWLGYSNLACDLESKAAAAGDARGARKWQCAARLARARTAELHAAAQCKPGSACAAVPAAATP